MGSCTSLCSGAPVQLGIGMALIDDAIEDLKGKSLQKPNVVPPPTAEQIAEAETKLGFRFPPSFLAFLGKAGLFALRHWETY